MRTAITRVVTLFAVVGLGLTACSTAGVSQDEAALQHLEAHKAELRSLGVTLPEDESPTESSEGQSEFVRQPIEGVVFENAWAEQQLRDFMTYQGARSLEGFREGSPERNIVAVTNPEEGIVRFEVRDRDYAADDWFLDGLAINYMLFTGCAAQDVTGVIVETVTGSDAAFQNSCS